MRVLDLMTIDVITVSPETTLKEAARLMVRARISGLPVVDGDGKLIGIVTEADFLAREADNMQSGRLLATVFDEESPSPASATVADAMTSNPVVIYPEANIAEAARLMTDHRIKRIPVVDADRRVVGIMSRADVVNAFTRPDDVIEEEIRLDLIGRVFGIADGVIDVEVEDGVVELSGSLPEATDQALLIELVRRLEGVVAVRYTPT